MAARINKRHDPSVIERIKSTQLINRLQAFALSQPDLQSNNPEKVVEMTPAQVKAALGLLKKTTPDLQNIEGVLDLTLKKHEEAMKELE